MKLGSSAAKLGRIKLGSWQRTAAPDQPLAHGNASRTIRADRRLALCGASSDADRSTHVSSQRSDSTLHMGRGNGAASADSERAVEMNADD